MSSYTFSPRISHVLLMSLILFAVHASGICQASGHEQHSSDAFTFVIIPDTHYSSKCTVEQLEVLTDWIIDNAPQLNILMVGHLGDVADERGEAGLGGCLAAAGKVFKRIVDADIPISVAMGNHDRLEDFDECYPDGKKIRQPARLFNNAFGREFYENREWFGGIYEDEVDDPVISSAGTANHYIVIDTPAGGFLVLTLEYYPRVDILDWAQNVVERYPEHHVIVLTHAYLNLDGTLFSNTNGSGKRSHERSISAEEMWKSYFSHWKNLRFIMNGHYINEEGPRQYYLPQVGIHGNGVHSHVINYQNWIYIDGQLKKVGRSSLVVRLLTFYPQKNMVVMRNYLPEADVDVEPAEPAEHPFIVPTSSSN